MAWSDKTPETIDKLIAAGLADGYLNRPPLPDHLAFYLDAFWELCGERLAVGGAIPFAVLDRYAARNGVPDDDLEGFRRFVDLIRRLDQVFLKISGDVARQHAELSDAPKRKRAR